MTALTVSSFAPSTRREQKQRPNRNRPAQGAGRAVAPNVRARSGVAAPQLRPVGHTRVASCTVEAPQWRLTDRGLALIMIVGLALAVAAMVAITTTAITVTSPDYQPASSVTNPR